MTKGLPRGRDDGRVRYHYVIADYLCRVAGGTLAAASDADAVRWVERTEWNSHSALGLDPVTVRVIEAGWQRATALNVSTRRGRWKAYRRLLRVAGVLVALVLSAGLVFWARPVSCFNGLLYLRMAFSGAESRSLRIAGHRVPYYVQGPAEGRRSYWCMGWAAAPRIGATWRLISSKPAFVFTCPTFPATAAASSPPISPIPFPMRLLPCWASWIPGYPGTQAGGSRGMVHGRMDRADSRCPASGTDSAPHSF